MTCCLVATLPGAVVAAADTRITIEGGGEQIINDGPNDLRLTVASTGRVVLMAYPYRKLRHIAGGWVVAAGEFASATVLLDQLKSLGSADFQTAQVLRRDRVAFLRRLETQTAISEQQLSETVLIGAALNAGPDVWCMGWRDNDGRNNRQAGSYAINYPPEVALETQRQIGETLKLELGTARAAEDALGLIKAVTKAILSTSQHSVAVGPRVQAGITVAQPGGGRKALYFDDSAQSILALSANEFFRRGENAD